MFAMIETPPTPAVCRFKSMTISPAGIDVNEIVFVPSEYAVAPAFAANVFSIVISGGALPRGANCDPQATVFVATSVQYGLLKQTKVYFNLVSHHCRTDGSGFCVHTQYRTRPGEKSNCIAYSASVRAHSDRASNACRRLIWSLICTATESVIVRVPFLIRTNSEPPAIARGRATGEYSTGDILTSSILTGATLSSETPLKITVFNV